MADPTLRDLQQWMKSRIRPACAKSGEAGRPAAPAPAPGTAPGLNPQRGAPGDSRLSVYADGYLARTREALAEVYEAVRRVVGEAEFARLAAAYAEQVPSRDYNLTLTGRHLPALLDRWPLRERLPFLPDLARLEWLVCLAFHAFDRPRLDPQGLSALPPERWDRLRLVFQPSLGVIRSAWPIGDIWSARRDPRGAIDIALEGRPQQLAVCRDGVEIVCRAIDRAQFELLSRLMGGATLGAACATLAGDAAQERPVTEWFAGWMRSGWVTAAESAGA